jgi:fructose-1,6-bisphosphatase/inositol monophosphatase family enzyme
MKHAEFLPIISLMENVGRKLIEWRTNVNFRQLHSKSDFKTEADRRSSELISVGLAKLFPNIEIISEENPCHSSIRPNAYWLIDPIDGTASWYNGFDGFVTQAAYIENKVPLFGIVHAPVFGKSWTGLKGCGARLNGKSLLKLKPSNRLILTDNSPRPHGITKDIMVQMKANRYLERGSLGLKSVLVADGTVDLFVKDVCVRDWDLAPAAAILSEVGGHILLANGLPFVFDGNYEKKGGFIVARDISLLNKTLKAFMICKRDIAVR